MKRKVHLDFRLCLEKRLIAILPKRCRHIAHILRFCGIGKPHVLQKIKRMRRLPIGERTLGPHLQQNQILLASQMPEHRRKRFPIQSLVVDANAAPARTVPRHLPQHRVDRSQRFSRARLTRDQPSPAKIIHRPRKSAQRQNRPRAPSPTFPPRHYSAKNLRERQSTEHGNHHNRHRRLRVMRDHRASQTNNGNQKMGQHVETSHRATITLRRIV
ncbi:hypothetical protein [Ereboglobus luteus]|uniref:hypothetical protein n=1 Tax=Ereboglobus luteus TaxID=1796921 RepID=UPI001374A3F2|nr:hypothetical protein [Ereboglobus luteus]